MPLRSLKAVKDLALAGRTSSGKAARRVCARTHPDPILIGAVVPDMTGAASPVRCCRRRGSLLHTCLRPLLKSKPPTQPCYPRSKVYNRCGSSSSGLATRAQTRILSGGELSATDVGANPFQRNPGLFREVSLPQMLLEQTRSSKIILQEVTMIRPVFGPTYKITDVDSFRRRA